MNDDTMRWFRQARYGLFIHWGLYAIPAGNWKGRTYHYGTEWLIKNAQIPVREYARLAEQFNPIQFDAEEWMRAAAEDFGMKYVVFTAKHSDGFAMYDSAASPFNSMHTPFGTDAVRELAEACRRHGMTFCLYYSQLQDWTDPNAYGNTWDFGPEENKDFRIYMDGKVKPQLHELLTQYGPIGLIWFDTPYEMPEPYCRELVDYVRSLQPDCLVNGRVGYGLGDYREMSDNSIPARAFHGDWETPMTLNDTWGYRREDENWKSPKHVVTMLVNVAGKGGNLLLNIGPDALGVIPPGSTEVLKTVGSWMKRNGKSIYGTQPAPDFPYQLDFGGFTYHAGHKRLYMHILKKLDAPFEVRVTGLKTPIRSARLLATGEAVQFSQTYETARDEHRLRVWLPSAQPDTLDTVIALDLDGQAEVQTL